MSWTLRDTHQAALAMDVVNMRSPIFVHVDRTVRAVRAANPGASPAVFQVYDRPHGPPETGFHALTGQFPMDGRSRNPGILKWKFDPVRLPV